MKATECFNQDDHELFLKNKAWQIALKAHDMQFDKGGNYYINHVREVLRRVEDGNNFKLDQVAILHDVIEDSKVTISFLKNEGFSDDVIDAIVCLTKTKGEPYQVYIDRVSKNRLATKVKIADLADNMNVSRLKEITENDINRLTKYHAAYKKLTSLYQVNTITGAW